MDVDAALLNARAIYADVSGRISEIETEEDARFQLIDRLLKDVLGWAYEDIKTEPPSESGYTDYLLKHNGKSVFVVEAKRIGRALVDTRNPSFRNYKIGVAAIESALSGIAQAARYCFDHGVSFAAVTTGTTWIAFMPFPGEGQNYKDGTAIVFPSLESVLADFAKFYDLFAKDSIIQKLYRIIFSKMSGETIFNAEELTSINSSDDIKFLQKSSMAHDLEIVFKEFFGTLSGDSDPEMLVHCFVETKESKSADFALEKIIDNLVSNVTSLKTEPENALADHIQISVEMGRGDAVVIIGNKGAGKSTFIERFFKIALSSQLREKCIVLKVDLLDTSGNQEELTSWMTSRMVAGAEREMFAKGRPSYDELQGLYFSEYQRWMEGHYKPLYDTNKTEFKIKFGEFLHKTTQEDKLGYLKHLLEDCVNNRHLTPCLIFDNTDQF